MRLARSLELQHAEGVVVPDFARGVHREERVVAEAAGADDELAEAPRVVADARGIDGREPLVEVVVAREDEVCPGVVQSLPQWLEGP